MHLKQLLIKPIENIKTLTHKYLNSGQTQSQENLRSKLPSSFNKIKHNKYMFLSPTVGVQLIFQHICFNSDCLAD